jgi:hypothetical protein
MFEALTESQLDAICGGKSDEPLPPVLPARAVSGPYSLGSYAKPLSAAATQTKLPPYITVDRSAS